MILASAALLIAGISANDAMAQRGQGQRKEMTPQEQAEKTVERLDKQLDLTDAQEAKLEAIFLKKANEAAENKTEKKEDMKEDRSKMNEEVAAVLTAEQKVKYEEIQKKMAEQEGKRPNRGGGGGR